MRWNGGGDLFDEAIAIEYIHKPAGIVLWIVSRKAELAAIALPPQPLHSPQPRPKFNRSKVTDQINV